MKINFSKYILEKKELVEERINRYFNEYKVSNELEESMEYSLKIGGKRLRPIIMYMMCDIYKKEYVLIEDIALSLEFIHTYSLVHDDLPAMDNDTYRRGHYTTHIKYGEANAILCGDALLTEAFNIISCSNNIDDTKKIKIIQKLTEYSGYKGMIKGQFLDILSENKEISYLDLKIIHENKTAKLLIASFELALIALDIPDDEILKIIEFSKNLGIAYQIKDDLLDVEGDFSETGKESSDVENKKSTYPSLLGINKSKELLNHYTNCAKEYANNEELLNEFLDYLLNRKK